VACPSAPPKANKMPLGASFNDNLSFCPFEKMAIAIPERVRTIPQQFRRVSLSFNNANPSKAVIGGTRVIISIENLDPMIVYDLNKNKSPKTKPINPDRVSHVQFSTDASHGRNIPLLIRTKTVRKINPKTSLMILTDKEPTLRLADSNASAVIVQKMAVARAANSPG